MKKFTRGITDKAFISALNNLLSNKTSFWYKIVHDKDLFIAIRNNFISVYYRGNSICKLSYKKGDIIGSTHYKFLLNPDLNEYIKSQNGIFPSIQIKSRFLSSLDDIKSIKKASSIYAGLEKTGVGIISMKKNNVVDVEITFEDDDTFESATEELSREFKKKGRIDYARLEGKDNLKLVFYEAKHFSNSEIRSNGTPKVFGQLDRYIKSINAHQVDIIQSYTIVCKNLKDLNLTKSRKLVERVANGEKFSIDFEPRLIIFGYDKAQKDSKRWKEHREKLEHTLGKNRLRTIGHIVNEKPNS